MVLYLYNYKKNVNKITTVNRKKKALEKTLNEWNVKDFCAKIALLLLSWS